MPARTTNPKVLNTAEIGACLGTPYQAVQRWHTAGHLKNFGDPVEGRAHYTESAVVAFGKAVGLLTHDGEITDAAVNQAGDPVERKGRWLPAKPTLGPRGELRYYLPHVAAAFGVSHLTAKSWLAGRTGDAASVDFGESHLDELGRLYATRETLAAFAERGNREVDLDRPL